MKQMDCLQKQKEMEGVFMTEEQKLLAGLAYMASDNGLRQKSNAAKNLIQQYNALPAQQMEKRKDILQRLLKHCGKNVRINQPFFVDYGCHITIGDESLVNMNCTFLDTGNITIGSRVLIGPDVKIYTAHHPKRAEERFQKTDQSDYAIVTMASSVTIGDDTWIGGGSVILPGITIGSRVIIGAGSVVTKNIPDDVTAAGNPCRVIKQNDGGYF